jgi:L,D-peptidoglycan transpeptidase YkuD (ErfK/YbiS/YcfS/YnhG family)
MSFRASASGWIDGPSLKRQPCVLGYGGVVEAAKKREGDGGSPAGIWPLRRVLYRPDRLARPQTLLPVSPLAPDDGWCDAPDDPSYNLPVKLPYASSAERLWRDDHAYDIIVVLGYNDAPVRAGIGSCIFWHVMQPDGRPTEGCVAVALDCLLEALATAKPGDSLAISIDEIAS